MSTETAAAVVLSARDVTELRKNLAQIADAERRYLVLSGPEESQAAWQEREDSINEMAGYLEAALDGSSKPPPDAELVRLRAIEERAQRMAQGSRTSQKVLAGYYILHGVHLADQPRA